MSMGGTAAIILAAGRGSRLGWRTADRPKCLVEVAGRAIIDYGLDAFRIAGIERVVVVVGYCQNEVRRHLAHGWPSLGASFVVNDRFQETGTSESLRLALAKVDGSKDVAILEGDVVFDPSLLQRVLAASGNIKTAVQSYRPDLSGTFVALGSDGRVLDWVHASRQPAGFAAAAHSKTVNLHCVRAGAARRIVAEAIDATLAEDGVSAPLEYAMRRVVDGHEPVWAVRADDVRWYEVDDEHDLRRAESLWADTGPGCGNQVSTAGR